MPRQEPEERSPPHNIMWYSASHGLAEIPLIRLGYPLPVRMGFVKGAKRNACP